MTFKWPLGGRLGGCLGGYCHRVTDGRINSDTTNLTQQMWHSTSGITTQEKRTKKHE
ncbi:hypothetical protein [Ostreibacterium oceani]|uniref:hypothetical protein n=1 Tax=Ostreibacterium oceani TaxID=2654998 RepID=UPI001C4028B2|nr:hypothetical protein [Ostreibacterium oceani]